jgi:hypothetical protein
VAQQINLFNPVFLKQKRYFSALAMAQAIALIVVGVLAIYALQVRQTRALERVAAEAQKQLDERKAQIAVFARQTSAETGKVVAAELDATEARLVERRSLLDDVRTGVGGDAKGYSRYLAALARANTGGVWLTGVEIGAKSGELVIKGRALESALVPAYIDALKRQTPFAGRRVGELKIAAKVEPPSALGASKAGMPARYLEFSLSIPLGEAS